jgi:hypothetical protein
MGNIVLPASSGQAAEAGLVRAYANNPNAQDPSYPFPFYFGAAQTVSAGIVSLPFCGIIGAGPNSPFCFFISKTLTVNDPYAKVVIELIDTK